MNFDHLNYESSKKFAIKSMLALILIQTVVSLAFVIYYLHVFNRLPDNIEIHPNIPYEQIIKQYGHITKNIGQNRLIVNKTELLNKFALFNLQGLANYIVWYLIFKVIGTKADWARPKLDKKIVKFYRLCWYFRLQYIMFPMWILFMLPYVGIVKIYFGEINISSWNTISGIFILLVPIGVVVHTILWKRNNIPIFW
jgi:hypothetical protein